MVAKGLLRPAGTRDARRRTRTKNDSGWRDAASRYPQSLPCNALFRASRVPAGRNRSLATTPKPRHIASQLCFVFADHFARARSTDRQTRRCRAVYNETIQILGFERCRTLACVAKRMMWAGRMSRVAHIVGMSGGRSQVDGRAGERYRDQLRVIGVDKRRIQRIFLAVRRTSSVSREHWIRRLDCGTGVERFVLFR